jgi:hypothetical protein
MEAPIITTDPSPTNARKLLPNQLESSPYNSLLWMDQN